jgi:glycosyltransferase involved in cell wall biosynthesis
LDVLWATNHILPPMIPKSVKTVVTIHDLVPYIFPKMLPLPNVLLMRTMMPLSILRADAIVADSDSTLRDVKHYFSTGDKFMRTIHLGADHLARHVEIEGLKKRLHERFGIDHPYILGVGTIEPRKNMRRTVNAFCKIADKIPHDLVLAGRIGWENHDFYSEIERSLYRDRILMPGFVSDRDLLDLYAGASVFVFPSIYEGFGFPPLEAMAQGTAVISSNVSSLPEVLGNAAHYVDPMQTDSISNGILQVLLDSDYRKELCRRGLEQVRLFTWFNSAQAMLAVFNQLGSSNITQQQWDKKQ